MAIIVTETQRYDRLVFSCFAPVFSLPHERSMPLRQFWVICTLPDMEKRT